MKALLLSPLLCIALAVVCSPCAAQSKPQPGDLYREYSLHNGGNLNWRVTDPQAVNKFERASQFLPNPRLELTVEDLEHAIRAEAMLDRWGGHRGTVRKRIRFNGNDWIVVPEIQNTPDGIRPEHLMFQDNPVVDVPLEHFRKGQNIVEGGCDEEGGFGWGQWGMYSLTLRVYYDPESKPDRRISGQIISPSSGDVLSDDPIIELTADATLGVARIDVLASYDGYDEDGDGRYDGWHESHFQLVRGEPNEIRDHVGTLWKQPYQVSWNTHWIPDQDEKSISLIARVQDTHGYWTVTEPVTGLTLRRDDVQVQLYRARDVPEDFAVRNEQTLRCYFDIPETDSLELATEAAIHLRTWHGWDGHHHPLKVNDHSFPIQGKNHFYDYDLLPLPTSALRPGENVFEISSDTEHHMLEVLWPGPALVVRRTKPDVVIREDVYEDRAHFVIETPQATYWLDQQAGGLSRLIDNDGRDWIHFRKQPWDRYPDSAASAFRGLPNLLFGNGHAESGFGHPGWDRGTSEIENDRTIRCTSQSGQWQLRWEFTADHVRMSVEKFVDDAPYWFLYEGPIAGRWTPDKQYFATNTMAPHHQPHDYFKGDRLYGDWRWAYFGDQSFDRVMFIVHEQSDSHLDTFAHLGNEQAGLESDDGMVVFGFGRGRQGIEPLLTNRNSFRIGFLEQSGANDPAYQSITNHLQQWTQQDTESSDATD